MKETDYLSREKLKIAFDFFDEVRAHEKKPL